MLRVALRLGAAVVAATVEIADAEARAILAAERAAEALPTLPRRAARVAREVEIALAQVSPRDPHPWHAFRVRFGTVHRARPPER